MFTINGNPEVVEPCMFVKGMYFYVLYCLCYYKYVSTDILENQVAEERDPDLNEDEDVRLDAIREEPRRDVSEEGYNKKKVHDLR